jgi:hypothetical protein
MEGGFSVGPTWAMSGDSFILDYLTPNSNPNPFKEDFNTGWSINGYVAGPFSDMFGWRAEGGYEKMPADADRVAGKVNGDYKLFRLQGGIQIAPFRSEAKGRPYGFFTVGLVKQDASLSATVNNVDLQYDFNGKSDFGLSFGGGYNYLIGESWGLGGDLHINGAFFKDRLINPSGVGDTEIDDSTRWWWTPSVQVFFKF